MAKLICLWVTTLLIGLSSHVFAKPNYTGADLIEADGVTLVRANCIVCHSSSVIEHANLSRKKWAETIIWMQQKHNLWPLGENKAKILDYLAAHYGIANKVVSNRRRKNL